MTTTPNQTSPAKPENCGLNLRNTPSTPAEAELFFLTSLFIELTDRL